MIYIKSSRKLNQRKLGIRSSNGGKGWLCWADYAGLVKQWHLLERGAFYSKDINQRLEPSTQCEAKSVNRAGKTRLEFMKTILEASTFQKIAMKIFVSVCLHLRFKNFLVQSRVKMMRQSWTRGNRNGSRVFSSFLSSTPSWLYTE